MEKPNDILPVIVTVNLLLLAVLGMVGSLFAVALFAPGWIGGWLAAMTGPEPKIYWYLSRALAFVAYLLVWLSVVLGLAITNRLARVWPGGPPAVDLHQFTSLLALSFASLHALVLLGDRYIGYTLPQLLTPFASGEYRPLWVGLGQVSLYLAALVAFSFYTRRHIGYRLWRLLHYASFIVYTFVTLHGLTAGTDAQRPLVLGFYILSVASVVALTLYRVSVRLVSARPSLS